MPAKVNGQGKVFKLRKLPLINRFTIQEGDLLVACFDRCWGRTHGGVGWSEVILRPDTGEFFRAHCWDSEASSFQTQIYGVQEGELPPGVTILEE